MVVQKSFQTKDLFFWRFGEDLGVEEVRNALEAIVKAEESTIHDFHRFFDLSEIKKVNLQLSDISGLAFERKAKKENLNGEFKSAIYAPTPFLFELASLYKLFLNEPSYRLGIFQNLLDAENWLKISLADL